jgi:hypothetical protein
MRYEIKLQDMTFFMITTSVHIKKYPKYILHSNYQRKNCYIMMRFTQTFAIIAVTLALAYTDAHLRASAVDQQNLDEINVRSLGTYDTEDDDYSGSKESMGMMGKGRATSKVFLDSIFDCLWSTFIHQLV